jgi:hypothetical protein
MKKQTQILFTLKQLLKKGQISRNLCLKNFFSRLGARMCDLKKEGLIYTTERFEGDYIYKVKGQKRLLKNLIKIYQ